MLPDLQTHVILQVVVWSFTVGVLAFLFGGWLMSRSLTTPTVDLSEEIQRWENAIADFHGLQAKLHRSSVSGTDSLAQFLSHELGLPEDEVLFWSLKIFSDMHRHHRLGEPSGYQLSDGRFVSIDNPFPKRISMWPREE